MWYNSLMNIITSKSNNGIKKVKKLHQKKYRIDSYLIEGWHLYEEAINHQAPIEQVFVLEEFVDKVKKDTKVTIVTPEVLAEIADSKSPQGIVAEIKIQPIQHLQLAQGRYLLLEDVQDPGNVGTMIRTADAASFDGVLLTDQSADLYNMKTLRSMQGSHFHLPVIRLPKEQLLTAIEESQLPIYATTLSQDSIDYKQVEKVPAFVLVMGHEGQGISEQMAEKADQLVHITMPGQAESLNVAVAAGILIFSMIEE